MVRFQNKHDVNNNHRCLSLRNMEARTSSDARLFRSLHKRDQNETAYFFLRYKL